MTLFLVLKKWGFYVFDRMEILPEMSVKFGKCLVSLDSYFGLRAWGLVIYGVLPANLALLDIVKVQPRVLDSTFSPYLLGLFLPVLVIFFLVRARHSVWYLTRDKLFFRSFITTMLILIVSTAICGLAGVFKGKYQLVSLSNLGNAELQPFIESLYMGVASLVLSSTLLMLVLTKKAALPGLPGEAAVTHLDNLRSLLAKIQHSGVFGGSIENDDVKDLLDLVKESKATIDLVKVLPKHSLLRLSVEPLESNLSTLESVLGNIKASGTDVLKQEKWDGGFVAKSNNGIEYTLIKELRDLRLGVYNE